MIKVEEVRKQFPILNRKVNGHDLIYLDNAATTQKPLRVIDSISAYYRESHANVHRGIHSLSDAATVLYEDAHNVIAQFINASEKEIIFTKGTTDSINMVSMMLEPELKKGDEIILTEMDHHSNILPWQRLKSKGVQLSFIPVNENYELDLDEFRRMISPNTRVVALPHVSNVFGTVNPVKEITRLAHHHGALVVIDGAQAAAHIDIDIRAIDADFYAFSAHKLYGPTGIGVLYGRQRLLEHYHPPYTGGGMVTEVTREHAEFVDIPYKFEAGTPDIAGAVGMAAGIEFISEIGIQNLRTHEADLTAYTLRELRKIEDIQIFTHKDSAGIISFVLPGIHTHDIAAMMDQKGIALRTGHHCAQPLMKKLGIEGTNRISLAVYNTKEEIDQTIEALKSVVAVCSPKPDQHPGKN